LCRFRYSISEFIFTLQVGQEFQMAHQYHCQFTVTFAAIPVARRAAYRNAIDILAEILLEIEQEDNEMNPKESISNHADANQKPAQEVFEMATGNSQNSPTTTIRKGGTPYANHPKNDCSHQKNQNIAIPGPASK
jgi:hypothetical protein